MISAVVFTMWLIYSDNVICDVWNNFFDIFSLCSSGRRLWHLVLRVCFFLLKTADIVIDAEVADTVWDLNASYYTCTECTSIVIGLRVFTVWVYPSDVYGCHFLPPLAAPTLPVTPEYGGRRSNGWQKRLCLISFSSYFIIPHCHAHLDTNRKKKTM